MGRMEGLFTAWGKILFIVHTADIVLECEGELPPGTYGRGYYNVHGDSPIGGHIRAGKDGEHPRRGFGKDLDHQALAFAEWIVDQSALENGAQPDRLDPSRQARGRLDGNALE